MSLGHDSDYAANCLRKREYFRFESIAGMYPYDTKDMVYVVISHYHTEAPLALFDGDVWHLLSVAELTNIQSDLDMVWVKRIIGTNDAYSEYPRESNVTMNALLERMKS